MIHDIRHAFNELLHENHWMDKETRLVAEDKANNIREQIGYPEYITNTTRLVDEYKNVSNCILWYQIVKLQDCALFDRFQPTGAVCQVLVWRRLVSSPSGTVASRLSVLTGA